MMSHSNLNFYFLQIKILHTETLAEAGKNNVITLGQTKNDYKLSDF
jgi:hypothetical protein